jgi:hypothetical protein
LKTPLLSWAHRISARNPEEEPRGIVQRKQPSIPNQARPRVSPFSATGPQLNSVYLVGCSLLADGALNGGFAKTRNCTIDPEWKISTAPPGDRCSA